MLPNWSCVLYIVKVEVKSSIDERVKTNVTTMF